MPGSTPDSPSEDTLKESNISMGIMARGGNPFSCYTTWSWTLSTPCTDHWREAWNFSIRPTTYPSRAFKTSTWASTSRKKCIMVLLHDAVHLSNNIKNFLTLFFLRLKRGLQLSNPSNQSSRWFVGLCLFLQGFNNLGLLLQLRRLLLER